MPTHKIDMWQPKKPLVNSDFYFEIHSNGEKLGTMAISKGTVDWWPKGKQKASKISWERFAAAMDFLAEGNRLP